MESGTRPKLSEHGLGQSPGKAPSSRKLLLRALRPMYVKLLGDFPPKIKLGEANEMHCVERAEEKR
jgi:hypothetical protein